MAAGSATSMLEYWKQFDLHQFQKELDSTATELANRQDESDQSRKRLIEQSREFKKNTPEDIRKAVAPLLKSFQAEVDNLSKRSKAAEASFLSVYKKLIDIPDPVPVLEHSQALQKKVQRAQDVEVENEKLRETLEEYNKEFAEVKNQEVTIKQLREKLRETEEKMESLAQGRAKEKEKELQRAFAEKERQLQETQMSVATKLGEAEHKSTTLQSALDSTNAELFELRSKYDELNSAKSDEMDMIMTDLERANQRAATAEREVETLKEQLKSANESLHLANQMQKAPTMEQAIDIITRSSLEVEVAAKEREVAQLVEDVQRLQSTLASLRESTSSQIAKLEDEVHKKTLAFKTLEEKLQTQKDYEEIKRELSIMKSTEFGQREESSDNEDTDGKSLEVLLLEKNRSLQSENTTLKMSNSQLTGSSGRSLEPAGMVGLSALDQQNVLAFTTMLGEEIAASFQNGAVNHDKNSQDGKQAASSNGNSSRVVVLPANVPLVGANVTTATASSGTDDLDTWEIARQVKDLLLHNNIGQKVFGQHVLGMSQGSVSEILSKPKHWSRLTSKGREPFIKMYSWLQDKENIAKLKAAEGRDRDPVRPNPSESDAAIAMILERARQEMAAQQARARIPPPLPLSPLTRISPVPSSPLTTSIPQHMSPLLPSSPTLAQSTELQLPRHPPISVASMKDSLHVTPSHTVVASTSVVSTAPTATKSTLNSAETILPVSSARQISSISAMSSRLMSVAATRSLSPEPVPSYTTIANFAGMSHPSLPTISSLNKPPRTVPPPLTSDQYQKFNDIDTMDLTRKIKDTLARLAIGQKVFGEKVLGLSQGSVSDMLAHPKPWSKLTQKGKEPFIRMQLWLEEVEHTGGDAMGMTSIRNNTPRLTEPRPEMVLPSLPTTCSSRLASTSPPVTVATPKHVPPPVNKRVPPESKPMTIQELVALSPDLDTYAITKRVKEVLMENNIGQRLFGETILGLTQGSVSDLLSRPKPWHKLSLKGREPFVRMHLWLSNPEAIAQVKAIKEEAKAHRRRHSTSSLSDSNSYDGPHHKKQRVVLSPEEKEALRKAYEQEPYPSPSTIEYLAAKLNLRPCTVTNWFHNYRSRLRRGSFNETHHQQEQQHQQQLQAAISELHQQQLQMLTINLPATPNDLPTMVVINQDGALNLSSRDSAPSLSETVVVATAGNGQNQEHSVKTEAREWDSRSRDNGLGLAERHGSENSETVVCKTEVDSWSDTEEMEVEESNSHSSQEMILPTAKQVVAVGRVDNPSPGSPADLTPLVSINQDGVLNLSSREDADDSSQGSQITAVKRLENSIKEEEEMDQWEF
ncbi:PREDICTED: homeobox protein cut-like 1 isoform X1 [Branchiostoma belcheri]|uniref:Homeobox protein cut-like n=1 Tax=Branchiostoma belcheri TaxID=7741 RepID=A0A6P4XEB1_BRABE|nr:PREDICTED: homeobox protein cut-like 1 isoform X1 [Branchiostoma belcheri]